MANKQINTSVVVVGQGLAGTCLSYQFHKEKVNFLVLDNSHYRSASKVAAGLINPIVFKRLTKSWMADLLMPYLAEFYEELEKLLNISFYEKMTLLRGINSVEEINTWAVKRGGEFDEYLGEIVSSTEFQIPVKKQGNLGKVNAASG